MKKLMVLCTLVTASTLLFSGGTKEAKPEEGPKTIRFATWGVQEKGTQGYFENFKSKFEAANPAIKIEWISYPYTQIKQQVLVMGAAGQIPDLMQAERGWLAGMISSGYTAPLDDALAPEYMKEVQPALKEDLSLNGKVWGAVWIYSPFILYYNKDLFKQAGLDPSKPPKTYQEALEYARKISKLKDKDGNNVYGLGITTGNVPVSGACLLSVLFSFGGGIWDAAGSVKVDTDPNREALEFLSVLYMVAWDDFLYCLTLIVSDSLRTLSVGISIRYLGEVSYDWAQVTTVSVIGSAPMYLLFLFFQRYMVRGLTAGAVKG
jgi:multiple sugar transport system substrate-binding protein